MTELIIRGVTIPNIHQGKTFRETLDNELKVLTIIYTASSEPDFVPYEQAIVDGQKMVIGNINSQLIARAESDDLSYTITLTLIELTKVLERYVLSPCDFTNVNDTLFQQINKALHHAVLLQTGEELPFNVTSGGLYPLTNGVAGEEWKFPEKVTLREVLDAMLTPVKCRVTVLDISDDFGTIYLGYQDLNRQSADIKILRATGKITSQSMEYLASDYETSVQNAETKERRAITDEWTLLKPVFGTIADTNNVRLIANAEIEQIVSVKVKYEATYSYNHYSGGGGSGVFTVIQIQDISDRFVEKEIFDTLSIPEQEGHIPYLRGSKDVGVLVTYKPMFWSQTKLENVLFLFTQAAAIAYIAEHDPDATYTGCSYPQGAETWTKALFQMTYVPYRDLHFSVGKETVSVPKSTMISNQTDSAIDADRYSLSLRQMANKLGNKQLERDTVLDSEDELLELGDRIADDYTLITSEHSVYDNYIPVHYVFVQHYSATMSARLARARDLYKIPIENTISRDVLIKEYLELSSVSQTVDDGLIPDDPAVSYFLQTFDNSIDDDTPVDRVLVGTVDAAAVEYKTFSLGLLKNALGKSMHFQFSFYDNYSVGLSAGSRVIGGKNVHLNPYCDANGEFVSLKMRFIHSSLADLSFTNQLTLGNAMPVVPADMIVAYTDVAFSAEKSYILYKGRYQKISISYQLEARTSNPDIVIGEFFFRYSNLLFGKNNTPLYIWVSGSETYGKNDLTKCKGYQTELTPQIDIAAKKLFVQDLPGNISWAIGDGNGHLLLGVNNPALTAIYLTISRK